MLFLHPPKWPMIKSPKAVAQEGVHKIFDVWRNRFEEKRDRAWLPWSRETRGRRRAAALVCWADA
jgi:hypothetical protein